MNILFILLALLGLGFLVFIHEFGHYWVARRVGITVEVFSIGFGRPIFKWKRQEVEWRVGWISFGGYVRMCGEDKKGEVPPHEIPGGFYAARSIDRIKVVLAGPLVNIIFAFIAFSSLWLMGGRDKSFSELTNRVGWIDPHSSLYQEGIRPGDIITSYDSHPLKTAKDHLHAPMLAEDRVTVEGLHVDYLQETKTPFEVSALIYPHPHAADQGLMTLGLFAPAQYLLYQAPMVGSNSEAATPLANTGVQSGDRFLWVDGELLFSTVQLQNLLAEAKALLTVRRGQDHFLARVPRVPIGELSLKQDQADLLNDWRYASGLPFEKRKIQNSQQVHFIPYWLSSEGKIVQRLQGVDEEVEATLFPPHPFSSTSQPLQVGDQVIAIDGKPMTSGPELLADLQVHPFHLMVRRPLPSQTGETPQEANWSQEWPLVPAAQANASFNERVNWGDLQALAGTIGFETSVDQGSTLSKGELLLFPSITPMTQAELARATGQEEAFLTQLAEQRGRIEQLPDTEKKTAALEALERAETFPMLGVAFTDRQVLYNPPPWDVFGDVLVETGRTLKALFLGYLNPKWLSGPVGFIQVMHYGWTIGATEALFWLGVLSLNLGILNLLPIPVLDGGRACFALWELVTRRRIRLETMERLIIPFVILMIGFFVFVTYQDISRLLRGFF